MSVPHGPIIIRPKYQITVPTNVAQRAALEVGDQVWMEVLDDPPGAVLMIPAEVVDQRWEAGKQQERNALEAEE